MKRFSAMVAALCVALFSVLAGCQRDVIVYPTGNYYLEMDMSNIPAELDRSSIWQVLFYDSETKLKAFETYITPLLHPSDKPVGAYLQGLRPGDYQMVVFNRDVKITTFNVGDAYDKVYAYALRAGYSESTPIVYEPDAVYSYSEKVKVPYVTDKEAYVLKAVPAPILETREYIVNGVKSLDLAEKIFLYVSRQDRGKWLCPVGPLDEKVIVMAEGRTRKIVETKAQDSLVIWTPVSTFGSVEGDEGQRILLTVGIQGPKGSVYYAQVDITDQFLSGAPVIEVTVDIEVEPLQQGGFDPEAKPWEEFITKIDLN